MAKPASKDRASMEEIEAMPAMLDTSHVMSITGCSAIYAARMCKSGLLKDCSVKVGSKWAINKAKALEALGLA